MKSGKSISLCQPDAVKGCCVCCGLFNLSDISKNNLTFYLSCFDERIKNKNFLNIISDFEVRDETSFVCQCQGFISKNIPGCKFHPDVNNIDLRDASLYESKICGEYLCPAHRVLSIEDQEILIKYIDDWYIYSIAIIDPESFSLILNMIKKRFNIDSKNILKKGKIIKPELEAALEKHAHYLNKLNIPLFYYSIPEYNLEKSKLNYCMPKRF